MMSAWGEAGIRAIAWIACQAFVSGDRLFVQFQGQVER
jgi:hypothetical protein